MTKLENLIVEFIAFISFAYNVGRHMTNKGG